MADLLNFGTTSDQKKMFNKMKHDLEDWREMILLANNILKWEKTFYAGIISGVTTFLFIMLWYLDLSILTQISLLALFGVVLDYLYPIISKFIFKPENWTGVQEKAFEEVCTELCTIRLKLCAAYDSIFVGKEEKSTSFYIRTIFFLIVSAYIGSIIDNLFLTYLAVVAILLYPGLQKHGMIKVVQDKVQEFIGTHLKFLKQKVTDIKKTE